MAKHRNSLPRREIVEYWSSKKILGMLENLRHKAYFGTSISVLFIVTQRAEIVNAQTEEKCIQIKADKTKIRR